jgi:carbamoyltransferase
MYILGISAFYHDSAACLYRNNTLLGAAEEERFSGNKGDSSFPKQTIKWLLQSNGISEKDIDVVCWYENPDIKKERVIETFKRRPIKNIKRIINYLLNDKEESVKSVLLKELKFSKKIHFVDHHLSHASLAYFTSNFTECNIITVDGVGEKETITISKASGNKIKKLRSINYPHSLGLFYSAFTAFLGFKPNEGEYKVMGLASYGDPSVYYDLIKKTISYNNGSVIIDMRYFSWDYSDSVMFNENLPALLDVMPRFIEDPLEPHYKHIAASVQKIYEEILIDLVKFSYELNNSDNLCLGGGCAYNGVANAQISLKTQYKKVWVPLSPSDGGSAIGACLNYINITKGWKRKGPFDAYQGPSFSAQEIEDSIKHFSERIKYEYMDPTDLIFKCSNLLNNGNVLGWFQGRMEFGSRALGNRSIIASPLFPGMQDRINSVIKKREMFRPFAPSVTLESATKFFETDGPVPYMNMVVRVKSGWDLPAITHVDGTARVQTVTPYENPRFYRLLKSFEDLSGYPILLNTSFNFKDQTITLYPKDAIIRFLDSEMDFLVLGNYLISKHDKDKSSK